MRGKHPKHLNAMRKTTLVQVHRCCFSSRTRSLSSSAPDRRSSTEGSRQRNGLAYARRKRKLRDDSPRNQERGGGKQSREDRSGSPTSLVATRQSVVVASLACVYTCVRRARSQVTFAYGWPDASQGKKSLTWLSGWLASLPSPVPPIAVIINLLALLMRSSSTVQYSALPPVEKREEALKRMQRVRANSSFLCLQPPQQCSST